MPGPNIKNQLRTIAPGLDAHPWELKACDGKRLAMEVEERAYNDLSAGAQGGNTTTNVNLQSR